MKLSLRIRSYSLLGQMLQRILLQRRCFVFCSGRRAFTKCEADVKIQRALRHQIWTSEEVFVPGDSVFYKRDGSNKWLGPGKAFLQGVKLFSHDTVEHTCEFLQICLSKKTQTVWSGAPKSEKRGWKPCIDRIFTTR